MSTRRRFSGDFKVKVALEALRGDKTIQEIATRHKIHPNLAETASDSQCLRNHPPSSPRYCPHGAWR